MASRKNGRPMRLEGEVIIAVVVLYLAICGAMLAIHYLQPAGQDTQTSSMSPSHSAFYAEDLRRPRPAMSALEAHTLLIRHSYQNVRNLRLGNDGLYHGVAVKDGRTLDVTVDPATRAVAGQPINAH